MTVTEALEILKRKQSWTEQTIYKLRTLDENLRRYKRLRCLAVDGEACALTIKCNLEKIDNETVIKIFDDLIKDAEDTLDEFLKEVRCQITS